MTPKWLKKYYRWCGKRSFIFQVILVAWTIFMFIQIMPELESPTNRALRDEGVNPYDPDEVMIRRFSTVFCPFGIWFIITLLLGIAAIATLGHASTKG